MPLRLPKSCMLGSRLWKNPASSYIMFEFLRQLGHKACTLFRELFEHLILFLEAPRNKRQFSKQIPFVAFNLGLIHKGVESLSGGQEEWSHLVCPCLSIESSAILLSCEPFCLQIMLFHTMFIRIPVPIPAGLWSPICYWESSHQAVMPLTLPHFMKFLSLTYHPVLVSFFYR